MRNPRPEKQKVLLQVTNAAGRACSPCVCMCAQTFLYVPPPTPPKTPRSRAAGTRVLSGTLGVLSYGATQTNRRQPQATGSSDTARADSCGKDIMIRTCMDKSIDRQTDKQNVHVTRSTSQHVRPAEPTSEPSAFIITMCTFWTRTE